MEQNLNLNKGIDSFHLKLIAIFGMTLDHIGIVFDAYLSLWAKCLLYALGGLTFPIMAYLLCEGYRHTRNVKKYMLRLLVFAAITQVPYMWALMPQINVLFTLLMGLLAIHITQTVKNKALSRLFLGGLVLLSIFADWGIIGVPMVLIYFYAEGKWKKIILPLLPPFVLMVALPMWALLSGEIRVLPSMIYFLVGCLLTIPLLANYNGHRGKPMRHLFYVYYPLHLVVLGLLRGLIFSDWGSLI